jgi:galactokinase
MMAAHGGEIVLKEFSDRFGGRPRVFSAPGRINIIGEHTDYSEGFVMPAAIDRQCTVAIAANGLEALRAVSLNRNEVAELPGGFARTGAWTDYVGGVRQALRDAGIDVPGCDLVISSDVPEGAGVSSSAALEVAVMSAMLSVAGASAQPRDLALWAQAAEVKYVGVPCGVMDQFIVVHGVEGHALVLDCRSLAYDLAPLPADIAFLVIDSTVRHRLVDGGYAARRADCETAASLLGVRVLRDATPDMLGKADLPQRVFRRARHVISENERVISAARALSAGEVAVVGHLMNASHASLRDDFDVTCGETDLLAEIAARTEGVHGARQMGGGFGGAVLALVDAGAVEAAAQSIVSRYRGATDLKASSFVCGISGGAQEIAT